MTNERLYTRIERLEKQNRQMKVWGGTALGALVAGLGFSFAQPNMVCDTVTAERFNLVNYQGETRATLDAYGRDEAILQLNQKDGQGSITLAMGDDGAGKIAMADSNGRVRTTMTLGKDGIPEFAFYSEKGEVLRQSRGEAKKADYLEKNSR